MSGKATKKKKQTSFATVAPQQFMNYVLHSFFLSELTPEPQSVQLQLKTKARGTEQGKRSAPEKKRENCTLIKVQSYLADTLKLPMYDYKYITRYNVNNCILRTKTMTRTRRGHVFRPQAAVKEPRLHALAPPHRARF